MPTLDCIVLYKYRAKCRLAPRLFPDLRRGPGDGYSSYRFFGKQVAYSQ
jgi:hypothetical protein